MKKQSSTSKYYSLITPVLFMFSVLFAQAAQATSIEAVTVEEALKGSELVIEGQVIKSETRVSEATEMIQTFVTIEVLEVIKGSYSEKTIVLPFLGGQYGDRVMEVGEMEYPNIGEQGIYFIETLQRAQAHSLFGWSQGHFLIRKDTDGVSRVTTQKNTPVTGMDRSTSQNQSRQALHESLSQGEAKGLLLEKAAPITRAMSVDDFKRELSKISERNTGDQ